MADFVNTYGPFYGGMLGKQLLNQQQGMAENQALVQSLGILGEIEQRRAQAAAIQQKIDLAKADAARQAEFIQGLQGAPDEHFQATFGMPRQQVLGLLNTGGMGALAKVLEKNAEMPEAVRTVRALPAELQPAALQEKAGIGPKFQVMDQGGSNIGFTWSPVAGANRLFEAPKTAAPGAVPFQGSDMTPEQYRQFLLSNSAAGAPRVGVNVSTERKYGEQFAGKIAESDAKLRDSAMAAPELAERANRIRTTLASGRVITGAGADARLAFGKAIGLAGASDAEIIANTETLASSLAQNTLDSIKASGLGGGTGFSNADREFLQNAVGGKITLEAQSLNRLAELAHRAASISVAQWNKRVKEIPGSALEGTGVSTEPVQVPALTGGSLTSIAPGEVRKGWRFRGGDPSNQLNWEKVR